MIQANFHGRGPPPRSYISQLLKRRIATAQAGAAGAAAVAGIERIAITPGDFLTKAWSTLRRPEKQDSPMFKEYADHDALGLAELVRGKQVTATELLETAIARAELVNPQLNA